MENNDNVDSTTVFIAEELFQSAYDRSSSDGNYEKKTEERALDNQQINELDEESLGRPISRQEERQSSQSSSIRLASEQKRQEISNLKRQRMLPSLKEKMAKQIEELKQKNKALNQELGTHESNSQALKTQLVEKQDIIISLSKRIQYFESSLTGEVQDMKTYNKRITEQLFSDLQKSVTMQTEKSEERRARIERDYVKKQDYQRVYNQKLVIEQKLQKMKENHETNTYLQTNRIHQRQKAEYLEEISKIKQALNLKLEENKHLERRICQIQSEYWALQKHISSNDTTIASQTLLIEQYQAQIQNLKTSNAKLHQKCINILSQTKDHIFLQFSEEIKAFTEQLEKLNEENKYLKKQFVKLKTIELENDRERMMKEIQLTFSRQKISLLQAVIKEKQDQAAETTLVVESILKMKSQELEAHKGNIKHLEKIIQDTTIFYTTLLQSKQAEWKILNEMNDDKTKALEFITYIREQAIQELTKKLNRVESDHAQQKNKQIKEYRQQLAKSENYAMQLQLELDQMKQKAGQNSEQKEKLFKQNRLMISLVKLIEQNQDNVKNILTEIESINTDHFFDCIVAAFFSLSQKMQNNELQIKTHQLALKNMQEQLQQNATQLQGEERIRQSSLQEKESQLQSLVNQLKQKAKIIQQLQEKEKVSSSSKMQVKQFTSKIESYIFQINEKNILIQCLQKEKSLLNYKIEIKSIQIQGYRSECSTYQYKIIDLQDQIKQLSRKNELSNSPTAKSASTQDKQLQILKKKYDSLLQELEEANKLITLKQQIAETQKSTNQYLEQKIVTLEQRLKKSSKATQIQEEENPKPAVNGTCCFFTAKSMIEGSKGGRQFVVKSVEKYCSREVKAVEMVFRKEENNNNNFHFSFKPADLSENICLFLLKRADVIFGIATFPETFVGTPSAFLLSVNNEKCVFKLQEGFDQAFLYEQNAITFGKKEIKIKSGFKNVTISDVVYKGYFENYIKREVFGQEFKEVSEFDSFEIHKIYV